MMNNPLLYSLAHVLLLRSTFEEIFDTVINVMAYRVELAVTLLILVLVIISVLHSHYNKVLFWHGSNKADCFQLEHGLARMKMNNIYLDFLLKILLCLFM